MCQARPWCTVAGSSVVGVLTRSDAGAKGKPPPLLGAGEGFELLTSWGLSHFSQFVQYLHYSR